MEHHPYSLARGVAAQTALPSHLQSRRNYRSFLRSSSGMAAAEVALLALIFVAMALWVGNKLVPAMRTAAKCLNTELSGGAACSGLTPSPSKRN